MPTIDPKVDAYIANAAPFAQPILRRLRRAVHTACPDVVENWKWSVPHFDYKGIFCSMAAFKAHCTFGFWKQSLLVERGVIAHAEGKGPFGRLTSVDDLPGDRELVTIIKAAAVLNDDGVTVPRPKKAPKPPVRTPPALLVALKKSPRAWRHYPTFPPSHRREYVEWIAEAKTDATRERRVQTAVGWIAAGKGRNWKYERR